MVKTLLIATPNTPPASVIGTNTPNSIHSEFAAPHASSETASSPEPAKMSCLSLKRFVSRGIAPPCAAAISTPA